MLRLFKQILILACLITVLIMPYFVFAIDKPLERLEIVGTGDNGAGGAGYAKYTDDKVFDTMVGGIIQAFLGLLGVIFIILIIIAGFNWMTAGGDEEKITKAKNTIHRAIVGIIIVAGSFTIWQFIAVALLG